MCAGSTARAARGRGGGHGVKAMRHGGSPTQGRHFSGRHGPRPCANPHKGADAPADQWAACPPLAPGLVYLEMQSPAYDLDSQRGDISLTPAGGQGPPRGRSRLLCRFLSALAAAGAAACIAPGCYGQVNAGLAHDSADSGSRHGQVELFLDRPGRPVNRRVLGNNVQWVDRGDELLGKDGRGFSDKMVRLVNRLGPTVLRYPGGSLSDLYHWRDGVGPVEERGADQRFRSHGRQRVLMGTREFLSLCARLGAVPLITVNTATGTPREAANWLAYTDDLAIHAHGRLPKVRYWEIGNEPYLTDARRRSLWIRPAEFARRADAFIRALKKTDPDIRVGIPLRSDRIGGRPATPYPGYNETVLSDVHEPVDFVALHDAYLPFTSGKTSYSDARLYWASMAAPYVVKRDFARTRRQLRRAGWDGVKLAVTEYSPLYTLSGKKTDAYISTLAGAMYVADLLRLFSGTDDLLTADYWSLTGNWEFGAVSNRGVPRPVYQVLLLYNKLLKGRYIAAQIQAPAFSVQGAGFVPAMDGLPVVTGLATRQGNTVRLLLINKDPEHRLTMRLSVTGGSFTSAAHGTALGANQPGVFSAHRVIVKNAEIVRRGASWEATLEPHSVTLLEWAVEPAGSQGE